MKRQAGLPVWVTTPSNTPYRERPAVLLGDSDVDLYVDVRYLDTGQSGAHEVSVFLVRDMTPLEALAWAQET